MVITVGNLVSPFTHQDYLSWKQATPEIENDLLSLGQVGLRKVHTLANDELSTRGGTDFYAQDSPQNQVFSYIHQNIKKITVKTNVQQETTALFAYLFDGGTRGHVSRDDLMSHELIKQISR